VQKIKCKKEICPRTLVAKRRCNKIVSYVEFDFMEIIQTVLARINGRKNDNITLSITNRTGIVRQL